MTNEKRRILIVEDDDDLRVLLADLLKDEGYHVETACDGLDAQISISKQRPDIVMSDIRMPLCDGFQLAHKLLDLDPPLPFLLVSGFAGERGLEQLISNPTMIGFLKKPLVPSTLINVINHFFERLKNPAA